MQLNTNDAGEQKFLRGGPEENTFLGNTIGDIRVVEGDYIRDSLDYPNVGIIHPSKEIWTGTDATMYEKIEAARAAMNEINAGEYDYNFPFIGTMIPSWGDLNDQNSNTVARILGEAMGLQDGVGSFIQDEGLNVPGYLDTLEHSSFEKNIDSLYDGITDAGKSIKGFAEEMSGALGQSVDDMVNGSQEMFRDLMGKAMSDVNEITSTLTTAYNDFTSAISASLRKDPLIIDMGGNGLQLNSWQNSGVEFDMDGDGVAEPTGWVKSAANGGDDAFLVIDKNSNGNVDSALELFGNDTNTGFEELRKYDSNSDNIINSTDTQFNLLKLWKDTNANGIVDAGEMTTLPANNITSISLRTTHNNLLINGNLITEKASVTFASGSTKTINEVFFGVNNSTDISDNPDESLGENFELDINTLLLPYSRGYGVLVPANDNIFYKIKTAA